MGNRDNMRCLRYQESGVKGVGANVTLNTADRDTEQRDKLHNIWGCDCLREVGIGI